MPAHRSVRSVLSVVALTFFVTAPAIAIAQSQQPAPPPTRTTVTGNDPAGPKDYVPCLFASQELKDLRGILATPVSVSQTQAQAAIAKASAAVKPDQQDTFRTYAAGTLKSLSDANAALTIPVINSLISASANHLPLSDPEKATTTQRAQAAAAPALPQSPPPTSPFQRPQAIACSMSIFPWDISHMVFGRTVANHYLAVQVIVRNLDQDHEFLIHDSELAVDAYSGQLERFQASHEKEAVRGVVVYGQNYDLHAVWSHTVEGIGMIAGAIVGLPQPSINQLTEATGAYSAGFLPTFQKLFPDLTTNNLNNLNDLGFSAASSSRIVVPKGGAVPFVIFVPVEPLEQACWLQKGYTATADMLPNSACDAIHTAPDNGQISKVDPFGATPIRWKNHWYSPGHQWPMESRKVAFKDWTPAELTALQKHAYAVVAGSLIQQLNDTTSLRGITCGTPDSDGKVYLAGVVGLKAAAKNPLNCTLTGSALDNMAKLRFEDATGATIADATVTPGADATTATAIVAAADVPKFLVSNYGLYSVDKSGTATDLKQSINLVPPPVIATATAAASATPSVGTLNGGSFPVALTGTNLDQVTQVELAQGAITLTATPTSATPTTVAATFTKPSTALAADPVEVEVSVGPSKTLYDAGSAAALSPTSP